MDELVERLRKGKSRTFEEVRLQSSSTHYFVFEGDIDIFSTTVNSSGVEDDDIIAGKQKMTLKCPVRMPFTLHLTTAESPLSVTVELYTNQNSMSLG